MNAPSSNASESNSSRPSMLQFGEQQLLELNLRNRRPYNKWMTPQRILLCCMRRFFNLSDSQQAIIFNIVFREQVRLCGFPRGLPSSTLNIQWRDMGKKRHHVWRDVHIDTAFSEGQQKFSVTFDEISATSQKAGILLERRLTDTLDISKITRQPRWIELLAAERSMQTQTRMTSTFPVNQEIFAPSNINTGFQEPLIESSSANVFNQVDHGAGSGTINSPHEGLARSSDGVDSPSRSLRGPIPCTRIPKLLWRWANDESMGINTRNGYVAYVFTNNLGSIPSPYNPRYYSHHDIRMMTQVHVHMNRIPTPFISTSIDPLVPIHRALRKQNNAIISLIDPTQVDQSMIFRLKELMAQYRIRTYNYSGSKEYLIWGTISKKAIVMTFKIEDLLKIAEDHADVKAALQLDTIAEAPKYWDSLTRDLERGNDQNDSVITSRAIGKALCMLNLHRGFLEDVALVMNNSWKFVSPEETERYLFHVAEGFTLSTTSTQTTSEVIGTELALGTAEPTGLQPCLDDSTTLHPSSAREEEQNNSDGDDKGSEDHVLSKRSQPAPHPNELELEEMVRSHMEKMDLDGDDIVLINTPCPSPSARNRLSPIVEQCRPLSHLPATIQRQNAANLIDHGTRKRKRSLCIELYKPDTGTWARMQNPAKKATPSAMSNRSELDDRSHVLINNSHFELERSIKHEPVADRKENFVLVDVPMTVQETVRNRAFSVSSESSESTLADLIPEQKFDEDRARVSRVLDYGWKHVWNFWEESTAS